MEENRGIRSLTTLENSASTTRVLNLLATHRKNPMDFELHSNPFFKNKLLNRAIILKHRLRPHEYSAFTSPKPTVTKVLIPIDGADLRSGAQSLFLGEGNFDAIAENMFGSDLRPGTRDRQVLMILDDLPSLDPFLLREHLRAHDIEPARGYFNISEADVQRMIEFVREEIHALVVLSNGKDNGSVQASSRLVEKLLSNAPDSGFEPLKTTLNLTDRQYVDGLFSWRGFLYYKWVFHDLEHPLRDSIGEMMAIQARGPTSDETAAYIGAAKVRIQEQVSKLKRKVEIVLEIYNSAYRGLTLENKPNGFRSFLLEAPSMFKHLGEQLGAMQHLVSFWRYRMPKGKPRIIGHDELANLFRDFEDGLVISEVLD
jgi:hypothetical protein